MPLETNRHHLREKGLTICLLGPCKLYVNGVPVLATDWKSKKALTLFKYLITYRGRMVRRDVLLELLWPDEDPENATRSLHTAIYVIRRMLEPGLGAYRDSTYIRYANGMYFFDVNELCWVDAIEFERLYREGLDGEDEQPSKALELFERAFSLYRGEYLSEETYADWAESSRNYYRELFISVGVRIAKLLVRDQNKVSEAIRVCRRILVEDPYREELHRIIMSYLIDAGRFAEAAMQYRDLKKVLHEEFDLPPSPETQLLFDKMQQSVEDEPLNTSFAPVDSSGPHVCDLQTFEGIHALAQREQRQHGQAYTLMRIAMVDPPFTGPALNQIFSMLQQILRRGDVLCLDQDSILLHLPYTDDAGSVGVKNRIEKYLAINQLPNVAMDIEVFEASPATETK